MKVLGIVNRDWDEAFPVSTETAQISAMQHCICDPGSPCCQGWCSGVLVAESDSLKVLVSGAGGDLLHDVQQVADRQVPHHGVRHYSLHALRVAQHLFSH